MNNNYTGKRFMIFCGKGNNGGDGLAIARMLSESGHSVTVFILEFGHKGTNDFQQNLARLHETTAEIKFIPNEETIPAIPVDEIIIDALLGTGLNRQVEGLTAALIQHINASQNATISIDIPSGLFLDSSSKNNVVVEADHTLTFQCYKLAFLVAENERFIRNLHLLDIHLHDDYPGTISPKFNIIDKQWIASIIKPRKKFSHKGDYGHGALIAGSKGMMGAAVLSAKAFVRSGGGKLTCHIPGIGYDIMQISVPEAMSKTENGSEHIQTVSSLEKYDAVGVGPGLGLYDSHAGLLANIFAQFKKPLVVDADALNILSRNKYLLDKIPATSVLTPHNKEFERIFGAPTDDFDKINKALAASAEYNIVIVLKGPYTFIALPSGTGYFNPTGNPGMATGGTGDVLTGIITSLLAQDLPPGHAAIAGVYLHGLAGDIAAKYKSQQSLIASDIINFLSDAFLQLQDPGRI
jgi:NAD(P)H-hydrate epimerase